MIGGLKIMPKDKYNCFDLPCNAIESAQLFYLDILVVKIMLSVKPYLLTYLLWLVAPSGA